MSKSVEIVNREHWLENCADALAPLIEIVSGIKMPNFRISCSLPSRGAFSAKRRRLGECWDGAVSSDGANELLISPTIDDEMEVAGVVAHELVHANVGVDVGHRGAFVRVVRGIGLSGKPTATVPGEKFKADVAVILAKLGSYPHAKMIKNSRAKVAATRLIKAGCPKCGYTIRVTRKWIEAGLPMCANDGEQFIELP